MTSATTVKPKMNPMEYIHILIGLFMMFGFGMFSPIEPLTAEGMHILGIFIGVVYLWTTVSRIWPSILGVVALGLNKGITDIVLNAYGNNVTVQLFFIMILFGAIQHAGVTKYISRWFLTRKIINGRPIVFSMVFMFAAFAISALGDVLPALILMWSVLYSVLDNLGYKKGDKYTTLMVIGTFLATISGQAFKPFNGSALMIVGAFEKVTKTHINFLPYMLFGFIMACLTIIVFALLMKFIFKPDVSQIANISTEQFEKDKLPPMNLQQKVLLSCLFAFIALILIPDLFPKTIGFVAFLKNLTALGVVMAFVAILCLVKVDNKPIIDFKAVASKHIIWDVYLVVAAATVISGALTQDTTGFKPFLTMLLNPLLGNPTTFPFIMIGFAMVITQFANNGAMGVLLMPIVHAFAQKNGYNPMAIATVMTFALHVAIMTPAASPFAAILYGNKDWVEVKDVTKYGAVIFFCSIILYLFIGIPLGNLVFKI